MVDNFLNKEWIPTFMKSIKWYKSNTWDKWSLTNRIFFSLTILGIFLWGISEYRSSVSYDDQKKLMEETAQLSAQRAIDYKFDEEIYQKTGFNSTEIMKIAEEFKGKSRNDYDKGLAYFNLGEYNSAIYFFNESLKDISIENNTEFYIGTSYVYLKKYNDARNWFERCINNFQCIAHIGGTYAYEGNYEKAIYYYEKSSSILPTPLDFYNLGTIYAKLNDNESFQKALFYFDKALEFNNKSFDIVGIKPDNVKFNKAYVLMKINRNEDALYLFKEVEVNGRNDSGIFVNLAITYSNLKEPFKSEEYAKKAIKIEPNNFDAHKALLISYYDTQRYFDCIKEYEDNKEILSDSISLSFVGGAYSVIGLPNVGIPILLSVLNSSEVNKDMVYVSLGASYAMINDYETALIYTKKALEINPNNIEANQNLKFLINNTHKSSVKEKV